MTLADPYLLLLVTLAIALFFWGRSAPSEMRRRRVIAWSFLGVAALVATDGFAELAHRALGLASNGPATIDAPESTALVVLTGGMRSRDPNVPPSERLGDDTFGRTIAAARWAKVEAFPIVVVSGTPIDQVDGIVELLVRLGVDRARIVVEDESRDTHENALFTARILKERGLTRAAIATSAVHLPRALRWFRAAGIDAIAAPGDVAIHEASFTRALIGLVPSSAALRRTHAALHEALGDLAQLAR